MPLVIKEKSPSDVEFPLLKTILSALLVPSGEVP